jgi:K+-transporting ATPase KdpF subunit
LVWLQHTFLPAIEFKAKLPLVNNLTLNYMIAGIVCLGLMVYLLYALICPENF